MAGNGMAERTGPQAGGFLLALSIIAGTLIGGLMGQPSVGLLVGTAAGILIAVAIWLVDRARRGD
jgi:uncharacterized membrane protein (UPF0136 family)